MDRPAGDEGLDEPVGTLEVSSADGHTRVRLRGEFDLSLAVVLRTTLRDLMVEGPADLDVNLAEVTFMDSSALGVLIGAQRQARVLQSAFRLEEPSEPVLRVLSLTALDRVFDIRSSTS